MVDPALVEVLAEVLCASSAVLFTFIATFSRSPKAESVVQNIIFALLIAAAVVLWSLPSLGGELWGSDYLPRPSGVVLRHLGDFRSDEHQGRKRLVWGQPAQHWPHARRRVRTAATSLQHRFLLGGHWRRSKFYPW